MIIKLSPQIRDRNKIWYEFEHQKITATINGVSDTFDFTDMPNGVLQVRGDEGNSLIETKLDEVPILSAKKEDGVLTVKILFSIDIHEQDERLLFPKLMKLDELNNLMSELQRRKETEDKSNNEFVEKSEYINLKEVDF